jgi:uncharacterized membrane protein YebE (DUF533 family)
MSAMAMLEQLLKSGTSAVGRQPNLGSLASGAAAGSVLTMLLGSRRGRSIGGSALKLGSVAALGALAYRAYADWQAKQAASTPASARPAPAQMLDRLPAPQAELHGHAVLKAMIAAAKSDGHLDERERGLVESELVKMGAEPPLRQWVQDELRRPVEPADVAQAATTPEMAAEVYLASLLMADDTTTMERAYLDELARQLKLPPGLKEEIEAKAAGA